MSRVFYNLLFIFCVSIVPTACARQGELIPYPQRETILLERSDEFFISFAAKKYDRVYDILSADTRDVTDKKQYADELRQFFRNIPIRTIFPTDIMHRHGDRGETRTSILVEVESKKHIICMAILWVWESENWYAESFNTDCTPPVGTFK